MPLPIPVTILTGFLGAGKTTLLKALLGDPAMAGTAVIVNEFGEIGLDDAILAEATDDTVLLPSGCICCAVRGDLVEALSALYQRARSGSVPEPLRVVIETTGLADPAPIAHTLMNEEELFRVYALDGIVTVVDAEHVGGQLLAHAEPAKQIAIADRVVVSKADRVGIAALTEARRLVRALNPAARILTAVNGALAPAELIGLGAFEPVAAKAHAEGWLAAEAYTPHDHACHDPACAHPDHAHDDRHHPRAHGHGSQHGPHLHGIASFALSLDRPLDARKLSFALELLRSAHGDKLLRVKGIVAIEGEPLPFVIHGVQHAFYPPTTLDRAPRGDTRSRLVFITRDLPETTVREVLAPLLETAPPASSAPDHAGWTEA